MRTAALALVAAAGVAAAQPADFIDLGVLTGDTAVSGFFGPGEVIWYRFELPGDASLGGGTFIDFNTNDSITSTGGFADTELGLYTDLGDRVANDDDDGLGLRTTLTFGSGSGLILGDSFNLNAGAADGRDGDLSAGVYFIAVSAFSTTHGDFNFDVTSTSGASVDYILDIYTNIPAPASVALLGLGGLVATRRRR